MKDKKNKVLLFYGNFIDDQPYSWLPNHLLFLTAPLVEAGFEPILITEFTDPDYEDIINEHAKDSIVFGISAMSGRQITSGLEAARIFKKYAPDTPIVWGGAHPSALPEQTLEHELVDIVFVGPSEISLLKTVNALWSGYDLQTIPGLFFKVNGKTVKTGLPDIINLNKLPPFPFHILKIEKYINPKTRVLNYTSSCGCPGACSFCSWYSHRHPWRPLLIKRILDDVEWIVRTYKLNTVWFSDSEFFYKKDFVIEFCKVLMERNLNIYWRSNGRIVDLIKYSKDDFKMLGQSGLDNIFIGVEVTSYRMMRLMRKVFQLDKLDTILERTKEFQIEFFLSLIFGAPTETIEDLELTYSNLKRWQSISNNTKFQTSIFAPYPATALTALAVENGFVEPKNLEEWGTLPLINDLRDTFYDRPWFDDSFNREYGKRFEELFPSYTPFTYKEVKTID